jgi:glutathione synthase/RimK-type ligase-like ATP-grasp enzyme
MSNYVIQNRALIEAVKIAQQRLGITYKLFSQDWIIRLEKNNQTHFIYAYEFAVNSQASAAIATDKVATFELLKDGDVACVPHYLITTPVDTSIDASTLQTLFDTYGSLVVKPTLGSRGDLVRKFSSATEIIEYVGKSHTPSWSISPFVAIQREIRIVVFKNTICLAYEKYNPKVVKGLKMFNLNLGAAARQLPTDELGTEAGNLALRAMSVIGLQMGAVDIIVDGQNKAQVLEVNSKFSLEHYAAASSENRKSVVDCYLYILREIFDPR